MPNHDTQFKFGQREITQALRSFPLWMLAVWSIIGSAVACVPISLILRFANIPTADFPPIVTYLVTWAYMTASATLMFAILRNRKFKAE